MIAPKMPVVYTNWILHVVPVFPVKIMYLHLDTESHLRQKKVFLSD